MATSNPNRIFKYFEVFHEIFYFFYIQIRITILDFFIIDSFFVSNGVLFSVKGFRTNSIHKILQAHAHTSETLNSHCGKLLSTEKCALMIFQNSLRSNRRVHNHPPFANGTKESSF